MHRAAPSAAEASRSGPAVKTGQLPADDDLVTSVAFVPGEHAEPVSPELALVDPTLAERLRADLSDPELEPEPVASPAEPAAEATTAPRAVVLEPDPVEVVAEETPSFEPEPPAPAPVAEAPEPPSASVHILRPVSAPEVRESDPAELEAAEPEPSAEQDEAVDPAPRPVPHLELAAQPAPEIALFEPEIVRAREPDAARVPQPEVVPAPPPAVPTATLPVIPTPPASAGRRPSSVSPLRTRSRFWHLLVLLATIVLFAAIVTVGVIVVSELRGGSGDPSTAAKSVPPTSGTPQAGSEDAPSSGAPQAESETEEPSGTPVPEGGGGTSAATPRRFAWAPVDGAVSYRFELFRGDQQVLVAKAAGPVYTLPTTWRHEGRTERLTPGSYRWYVWPVLASGPAGAAVVQASLDVP